MEFFQWIFFFGAGYCLIINGMFHLSNAFSELNAFFRRWYSTVFFTLNIAIIVEVFFIGAEGPIGGITGHSWFLLAASFAQFSVVAQLVVRYIRKNW